MPLFYHTCRNGLSNQRRSFSSCCFQLTRSKEQTTWERFMDALGRGAPHSQGTVLLIMHSADRNLRSSAAVLANPGRLAAAWGVISGQAFIASAAVLAVCTAIRAVTDDTFPRSVLCTRYMSQQIACMHGNNRLLTCLMCCTELAVINYVPGAVCCCCLRGWQACQERGMKFLCVRC